MEAWLGDALVIVWGIVGLAAVVIVSLSIASELGQFRHNTTGEGTALRNRTTAMTPPGGDAGGLP